MFSSAPVRSKWADPGGEVLDSRYLRRFQPMVSVEGRQGWKTGAYCTDVQLDNPAMSLV